MRGTIYLIFFFFLISGCSNKLYESNWKEPGSESTAFRFYHPESKIRYNIENDEKNLYISFDVMDQLTVQKILATGLRLFVDGSGKKKEKNELQFPVYSDKVPIDELREQSSEYDQSLQYGKSKLDQLIPTDGYLKFNGEVSPIFNNTETKGVLVSLRFDSTRSLVYRATIPLEIIGELADPMAIGFETGGFEMPQNDQVLSQADVTQANQGISAGDRAMGRGGSNPYGVNTPGGSTAAGMAMRNSTSYNTITEPIRFWARVKLSLKK